VFQNLLAQAGRMEPADQMVQFMRGLKPHIRTQVENSELKELGAAMDKAVLVDQRHMRQVYGYRNHSNHSHSSHFTFLRPPVLQPPLHQVVWLRSLPQSVRSVVKRDCVSVVVPLVI
jgi:hypothetical protein